MWCLWTWSICPLSIALPGAGRTQAASRKPQAKAVGALAFPVNPSFHHRRVLLLCLLGNAFAPLYSTASQANFPPSCALPCTLPSAACRALTCHPAPACLTAPTQIGQCKQQQAGSTHFAGGGHSLTTTKDCQPQYKASMLPSIDGFPPPPPPPPLPSPASPQAPSACLDPDTRPRLDGSLTLLTLLFRHRRQRFRSDQGPRYDHVGSGLGGLRALLLLLFLLLPKQAEMGIDLRILAPSAETYHLTGPAFRPLDTTGKQGPDPGPGEAVLRSKSSPPAGGSL
ncbi:uncharacterized protein VDAG_10076 [Verticillium dahliae VdLs.17]|uniref:Uncharacterized protein n=1 Tax=Verticillium dahliae (strain VdLs.17 / ATCC MYA-4575 / FGSC 10137) TaxID=498257 RepID=G2XIV3_VERDV|nr:uncharacterized protein VDAG_10076 [Verticillium dahliae VdLs.17]EGY20447.1 hypothetical protein VDAG_10076 [Verticillium dahliae VdLs.17]KAH6700741.1 hypothetical protein EV126DRAFT_442116 [Verticillium dahliae]